ncbi:unnamed protein product [Vicia faba]|uniref:Uncharacterized protein n=1 Tax=Vicia faba TaxID=3906 RepID=A0AAV0Z9U9_VICFA|nr:unnamed protein product [Vicia faba]
MRTKTKTQKETLPLHLALTNQQTHFPLHIPLRQSSDLLTLSAPPTAHTNTTTFELPPPQHTSSSPSITTTTVYLLFPLPPSSTQRPIVPAHLFLSDQPSRELPSPLQRSAPLRPTKLLQHHFSSFFGVSMVAVGQDDVLGYGDFSKEQDELKEKCEALECSNFKAKKELAELWEKTESTESL